MATLEERVEKLERVIEELTKPRSAMGNTLPSELLRAAGWTHTVISGRHTWQKANTLTRDDEVEVPW